MLAAIFAPHPLSRVENNIGVNVCFLKGKEGRCRNALYAEICVLIAEYDLKHSADLACEIIPFFNGIIEPEPILLEKGKFYLVQIYPNKNAA